MIEKLHWYQGVDNINLADKTKLQTERLYPLESLMCKYGLHNSKVTDGTRENCT